MTPVLLFVIGVAAVWLGKHGNAEEVWQGIQTPGSGYAEIGLFRVLLGAGIASLPLGLLSDDDQNTYITLLVLSFLVANGYALRTFLNEIGAQVEG